MRGGTHTKTQIHRTRDTWAGLKTAALGRSEQLGDLRQRGLPQGGEGGSLEGGGVRLAKKQGVEMAWGRRGEQICSASNLGREQIASYQTQAEEA